MIREFESYLSNKKHIKDKYVPYYMKWVSDCYSYLDESVESRLPADRIQTFLSHLSKKHEDWQVNPADYALRRTSFSSLWQSVISKIIQVVPNII
jgi:hypothetical protein